MCFYFLLNCVWNRTCEPLLKIHISTIKLRCFWFLQTWKRRKSVVLVSNKIADEQPSTERSFTAAILYTHIIYFALERACERHHSTKKGANKDASSNNNSGSSNDIRIDKPKQWQTKFRWTISTKDLRSTAMNTNDMWQTNWYFCHCSILLELFVHTWLLRAFISLHHGCVRVCGPGHTCLRTHLSENIIFFMSPARLMSQNLNYGHTMQNDRTKKILHWLAYSLVEHTFRLIKYAFICCLQTKRFTFYIISQNENHCEYAQNRMQSSYQSILICRYNFWKLDETKFQTTISKSIF